MDLLTKGLESFQDARHTCVITCPPDHRVLERGDKILVLRPWEQTPATLTLGKGSVNSLHVTEQSKKIGGDSEGNNRGGKVVVDEQNPFLVNLDGNLDDIISDYPL